jgi:preprotein translocase subunit SecG
MNLWLDLIVTLATAIGGLLVCLVLLQRGRGGGVSGLLGGSGAGSAFGPRTGDALTWATVATFTLFIALAAAASRLAH